ncbi:MAG: PKD domain-containing protein [Candidatus Thermoplasmatota archaeon]
MKKALLFFILLTLALAWIIFIENADSRLEVEAEPAPMMTARGDEDITNTTNWTSDKEISGNLTIYSGGNLTLSNMTLKLKLGYQGQYRIEVKSGGVLRAFNSTITASSQEYHYLFLVRGGSTLILENTSLSGCGYKEGEEAGLYIATSDARLKNCTLENNHYGVYCIQSSPKIEDCRIVNNTFGIRVEGVVYYALPYIANNTISSNENYGIYCKRDGSTINGNDIFDNGGDGIYCDQSSATITGNDIFYNSGAGLYCYDSDITIENNNISSHKYGIKCDNSKIDSIKNNLLENNAHGVCCRSGTNISNFDSNTVLNGTEGIFCSSDSPMNIYNSTIKNASCGIHFCSWGEITMNNITENELGIYCDHGTPNITHNKITFNTRAGIHCYYSAALTFSNNNISNNGWGIYAAGASLSIENNNFKNNSEGILWQEWYPMIHVINQADGSYVAGANVTVKNCTGVEVFTKTTDTTGIISTNITEYKILNDGTPVNHTPHEITAHKEYVGMDTNKVNLDGNKVVMLYLKIPDLTPIDLFTLGSLTEGNRVTVVSPVLNQGTLSAANANITFLCDNETIGTVRQNILAGAIENISVPWLAVKGEHELRIEVDLNNTIEESIETNNNRSSSIYVNTKPIANLSTAPNEVYTYEDVTFSAAYYDPDPGGMVVGYLFEFGDGTNSSWTSSWVVKHNYTRKGTYYPKLKVKDNFESGVESEWFIISTPINVSNRIPIANITASKNETYTYEEIIFYGTDSYDSEELFEALYGEVGHKIIKYYWDFGDDVTIATTSAIVSHSYTDNGIYTVKLIVQDDDFDNSTEKTFLVRVLNRAPLPSFTVSKGTVFVKEELNFNASNSQDRDGSIVAWYWDFGDGNVGYGNITVHKYAKPGIYSVVLTVFDNDGASASSYQISIVVNSPTACFSANKILAFVNERIEFDASSSLYVNNTLLNYTWDFGDGTKGYEMLCSHAYAEPGTYLVTLTVSIDDVNNSYAMLIRINPLPTWIELHYKEIYVGIAAICVAWAVFFATRWYVYAKRREEEVRVWAEKRGIAKEKALEEKLKEWAAKKKEVKGIEARLKDWAKRREEVKRKKELEKWAERKKLEKEK